MRPPALIVGHATLEEFGKTTLAPLHHPVVPSPNQPHFPPLHPTWTALNGFVGQYEHQMDQKGRVSLPSAFRREAEGDHFVLLQWEEGYLTLFPQEKWQEVQGRLLEFRRSNPEGWNQVRTIIANAVEVTPDKQGRILVPAALQAAAELQGAVLLSGNLDRVELWNPATYRARVQQQVGDIAAFSHKLFG